MVYTYGEVLVVVSDGVKPVAKPTAKAIAAFEKRNGFFLPPSYKDFIKKYGPGEIGCMLRIAAPGCPANPDFDLESFNQDINIDSFRNEFPANHSKTSRYFFFGDTYGGDMIAWQTSKSQEGEYPIVAFPRDNSIVVVLASTFDKLIDAVLKGKVKNPIGKLHPETEVERHQFRPAILGK